MEINTQQARLKSRPLIISANYSTAYILFLWGFLRNKAPIRFFRLKQEVREE